MSQLRACSASLMGLFVLSCWTTLSPGQSRGAIADLAEDCARSLSALSSDAADERERAARYLLENCDRVALARAPSAASQLRKAVELGSGAAPILLLGHYQDEASRRTLLNAQTSKPVKLRLDSHPVPASLVVAVALARSGDTQPLMKAIESSSLEERRFLLDVLGEIDLGLSLRALALKALTDEREVPGGVPSGATPSRRLCDVAVDAFTHRLTLELSFRLTPSRRYTPAQLAEVRRTCDNSIKP